MRPPGRAPGTSRASTAGLSTDRLITQLEMTTSTEASGSGIVLDGAFDELDVGRASLGGVGPREREHLVGHVDAVGEPGRADPPGRQEHVDAAAGPRSSTRSPALSSATISGLPQPRLAATASAGSSPCSAAL